VLKKEYFDIIDDRAWSEEAFANEGIKRFCEHYPKFKSEVQFFENLLK